jgi:death-on-curing protein
VKSVRFLSAEQVTALHDALLERWGGDVGGGHRGPLYYEGADAAVQAVKNSYYGTIEELAAAYAVYVVQGHVFLDGNKRTGAAAMLVFLEANGIQIDVAPTKIVTTMIELQERAEAGEDARRLVQWLAGFLIAWRQRPKSPRRPARQTPHRK